MNMKSVMLSIKPQWCGKICNKIGEKDGKPIFEKPIEVRKGKPSEVPFKAFIYCTKSDKYLLDRDSDGSMFCWDKKEHHYPFKYEKDHKELFNGKVIGEFICDKVEVLFNTNGNPENYMTDILPTVLQKTALSFKEFQDYVGSRSDKNNIYGWHISDLKIYDKPKELSEFKTPPCEKSEKACEKCKYRVVINTPDMYEVDCFVENGREISRPPQSWMYVEEI